MGVHDGLDVGAHAIDEQVHADFAGHTAAAGDLLAVEVDDDHVGGAHGAFADGGGGYQDAVAVEAYGEIAIHGGHVPVFMEHPSVTDDFFPVLAFRRHGYPWGENDKKQAAVWLPHSISRRGAETIHFSGKAEAIRGADGARVEA